MIEGVIDPVRAWYDWAQTTLELLDVMSERASRMRGRQQRRMHEEIEEFHESIKEDWDRFEEIWCRGKL